MNITCKVTLIISDNHVNKDGNIIGYANEPISPAFFADDTVAIYIPTRQLTKGWMIMLEKSDWQVEEKSQGVA